MAKIVSRVAVIFAVSLAGACYENPTGITLHQAHLYKGKADEHDFDRYWLRDQLHTRFTLVQSDR